MAAFDISFRVLPVGGNPNDPNLERRNQRFEFTDPAYGEVEGQDHAYGPPFEVMEAAVNASLTEGATGIIDSVEFAPAGE